MPEASTYRAKLSSLATARPRLTTAAGRTRNHLRAGILGLSTTGVVAATLAWCISLAPSLIPRNWLFQAILTGILVAIGYGFGAMLGGFTRWLGFTTPWGNRTSAVLWRIFVPLAVFSVVACAYFGAQFQSELRVLFGMPASAPWKFVWQAVIAIALAVGLVAVGRLLRRVGRWIARKLSRWFPYRAAVLSAVIIVAVAFAMLVDGTLVRGTLSVLNSTYATSDKDSPRDAEPPVSALRSGSPQSLESWESLGFQGRAFVSGGPDRSELASFSSTTDHFDASMSKDPIRVYAGLAADRDLHKTAQQVVAELDRTGAWDRKVLMVATATGTGWIDPALSSSLEFLHNGDTAIASMQYSYLPSWLSFLTDRTTPPLAGKALFEAVYEAWLQRPEAERPELYVSGLSLGSFGMQGAFSGLQDITERTDGALFVGTPSFTPHWMHYTESRDAGSREIAPIFDGGRQVRFSSQSGGAQDLWSISGEWRSPRVAYVQHASDAVIWWSPDLIWNAPDWINEERGVDRPRNMRWYPVVTFLQVTFDMFVAGGVPAGHGHMYVREYADALAAVTHQDQLSAHELEVLKDRVEFGPESQ